MRRHRCRPWVESEQVRKQKGKIGRMRVLGHTAFRLPVLFPRHRPRGRARMLATPSRDDRGAIRLAQNAFNGIGKQPPSLRDASNSNTQERTQNAFKALTVGSSLSPSRKSRFGGEMTSTSTTSGSTSDGERLEPEPSNKKAWSGNPTPISAPTRMAPMPERALLPVGSGQQRPTGTRKSQTFRAPVETWRANNGAPRKIQKTVHGEDAPSSSRRQSTSTPKPAQVITIDDDDDDDVVQAVQNRTHTLLGVTPKSPFKDPTPAVTAGVKRPAPSTGTLDEDPIVADEDDDLIIVGGPSTSMRRQSTPDPRGTVVRDTVQKLEALPRAASANLRRVDFDKLQTQNGKKGGLASKMKKKETSASTPASAAPAPALSIEDTLFEGNKASDKSLKQRSSSDPDLQRVWGSAMNLPKHINKLPPAVDFAAKEKDRAAMAKRRERFGSVEKDKEKEPSRVRRSSMNPYGAAAPTVNGRALAPPKSRQPSHGPIPLEALCVGDAAEPGMELMFSVDADGKTLRVLGITEDDEAKEMMWLKVDEIKEVEVRACSYFLHPTHLVCST
ncbi:hypothetical protein EXIGLDRAFT_436121 [Exidia glandulosa HHB12029]|uniref:Uncharacterized protein n=1 Tax=Exidia glandulosa HHB12029 TaxID=1314781 RepID=A0A165B8Y0_EXIGL|nr:hypothetical protein EXIGLDRAFT_436121 [Exidia glandulosa HHB12029]